MTLYIQRYLLSRVNTITLSAVTPDCGGRSTDHLGRSDYTLDNFTHTTDCKLKLWAASIGSTKCFILHLWSCRTIDGDYASRVVCLVNSW